MTCCTPSDYTCLNDLTLSTIIFSFPNNVFLYINYKVLTTLLFFKF